MEAAVAEVPSSLVDVLTAARGWAEDLADRMDGPSRVAFYQASSECQQLVLDRAKKATVVLLGYSGLSEAAWQRRLARAEQRLAARSEERGPTDRLVLRLPTASLAALESVLGMQEAARKVLDFEVRQVPFASAPSHPGLDATQLLSIAQAFPNLHTLRISRLCGPLPAPALMPNLRDLQCVIRGTPEPLPGQTSLEHQIITSIAPFTTQISALTISHGESSRQLPWSTLIPAVTKTLSSLAVPNHHVSDDLVQLLCDRAPSLHRLSCVSFRLQAPHPGPWSVRQVCAADSLGAIAHWPDSPEGLLVTANNSNSWHCTLCTGGPEGLSAVARLRMHQWRFACPGQVDLHVVDAYMKSYDVILTELRAALQQLGTFLPAGSVVHTIVHYTDKAAIAAVTRAVAVLGPDVPHLMVVSPKRPEWESDVQFRLLMQCNPPPLHAHVYQFESSGRHNMASWPWRSLHVSKAAVSRLVYCPDPTEGQYEIWAKEVCLDVKDQWSASTIAHLQRRLSHFTFVVHGNSCNVTLTPHHKLTAAEQPAALRRQLAVLRHCRWRRASGQLVLRLENWALTHTLVQELRGLPVIEGLSVELVFQGCSWLDTDTDALDSYAALTSMVPSCYSTWWLRGVPQEALLRVCEGVGARGKARLTLRVEYGGMQGDTQRAEVEAYVDERGLSRGLGEIEWCDEPVQSAFAHLFLVP